MAVYIDEAHIPFGRMLMSHMVADTTEELLEMADKIGINKKWLQNPGTYNEHFDVSKFKRELAIKHGAIPINSRLLAQMTIGRAQNKTPNPFKNAMTISTESIDDTKQVIDKLLK